MVAESRFSDRLFESVPPWALGAIGTLFAFAIVLKIVGIDFAGPINGITEAYTDAISQQAKGMETINSATNRMEAVSEQLSKSVDDTQIALGQLKEALEKQTEISRDHEARISFLENQSRVSRFQLGD